MKLKADDFKGANHILSAAAQTTGKLKHPPQKQQSQSSGRPRTNQQQGDAFGIGEKPEIKDDKREIAEL
jgi:hypothetical protein